jgi:hypothetical protein
MSDSVKKYFEMVEDGLIQEKETVKPNIESFIVSEGTKKQAFNILIEYPEDAIIEAARILKVGK